MAKLVFKSIFLTLSSRKHLLIAVVLALLMASIAVLIPSFLTPGNTLQYQLSILQISDVGLIVLFSSLFGIALAMQFYASHKEKISNHMAKSTGTGFVAFVGTLFSAKLCPFCLGAILGFIGVGGSTALLLFSYKTEIMLASIFILFLTIYLTGKRITKINSCERCR